MYATVLASLCALNCLPQNILFWRSPASYIHAQAIGIAHLLNEDGRDTYLAGGVCALAADLLRNTRNQETH